MGLLNKVKDDDRGLDISLYGTAVILVLFVSFCSIFDYWVLTFAKEQLVSRVEIYEFNALAEHVKYNQPAYKQDFAGTVEEIEEFVEQSFVRNFKNGIYKSNGLVYNVRLLNEGAVNCYPYGNNKIILESGRIRFQVHKILKAGSRVPFFKGNTTSYNEEVVYSNVNTSVSFIFH